MSRRLLLSAAVLVACAPAAPRQPAAPAVVAVEVPSAGAESPRPAVVAEEAFRNEPPRAGESKPFLPPSAVRARLGNGMSVVLVSSPSRFCTINLVAVGGMADLAPARPDKVDVVEEMLSMMMVVPVRRDKGNFEDRLRDIEMPYPSWSRAMDGVMLSASVPKEHFAEGAGLLAELVLGSSFDEHQFERTREQDARRLDDDSSDGAKVAEQVLLRALFGSHLYGPVATAAHRRAVTRADVVALHARVFQASRISIVVAGDVQSKDALAALENGFGKASPGGSSAPLAPIPPAAVGPTIVVVDRPGANTAFIAGGFVGAAAAADDEIGARMAINIAMNTVVGRGTRLRDELKLVPWTAAIMWTWRSAGELGWRTRTTAENVAAVLLEADRITHALATDGPTDDEVDVMRKWMATGVMSDFATPMRIAGSYADLVDLGVPDESVPSKPARVAAISATDVRAAAAKYFLREHMRVVVVGDLAALREPLTKLGWGPVEVRDPNGQVVRAAGSPAGSR
jgi:zinc protease